MNELRSAGLAGLSESELAEALAGLMPHPEFDRDIHRRILEFEIRYEVSSARMIEELRAGERRETAEIAEWLFWLRVLDGDEPGQA